MTDWNKNITDIPEEEIVSTGENDGPYPQPPENTWYDLEVYSCEYEENKWGPKFSLRFKILNEGEYEGLTGYHNMWLDEDRIDKAYRNIAAMGVVPPEGEITEQTMAEIISQADTSGSTIRGVVAYYGDDNEKWKFGGLSIRKNGETSTPTAGTVNTSDASSDPF